MSKSEFDRLEYMVSRYKSKHNECKKERQWPNIRSTNGRQAEDAVKSVMPNRQKQVGNTRERLHRVEQEHRGEEVSPNMFELIA